MCLKCKRSKNFKDLQKILKILKINNIKYNSVFVGYKMVMGEYEDDDDDKWERNKN